MTEAQAARSLHLTAAFTLAAMILYWPANVFPILVMNLYGATTENTIWQGCVALYDRGELVIAIVIFLASMVIPLVKLLGLFVLVTSCLLRWQGLKRGRSLLFRMIEAVGRWAMLDVFVLAILVSLVKLQSLATVAAGSGAVAFTGVVVLTLLASRSFDPRAIGEGL